MNKLLEKISESGIRIANTAPPFSPWNLRGRRVRYDMIMVYGTAYVVLSHTTLEPEPLVHAQNYFLGSAGEEPGK